MNVCTLYIDSDVDQKKWRDYFPSELVKMKAVYLDHPGSVPAEVDRLIETHEYKLLLVFVHFSASGAGTDVQRVERIEKWTSQVRIPTVTFLTADGGLARLWNEPMIRWGQLEFVYPLRISFETGIDKDMPANANEHKTQFLEQLVTPLIAVLQNGTWSWNTVQTVIRNYEAAVVGNAQTGSSYTPENAPEGRPELQKEDLYHCLYLLAVLAREAAITGNVDAASLRHSVWLPYIDALKKSYPTERESLLKDLFDTGAFSAEFLKQNRSAHEWDRYIDLLWSRAVSR